jgi:amino acid adenylation domain-containing protein
VVTAPRQRITDMDRLPMPDRSMIDYNKYNRYISHSGVKHSISLEATRGCPYGCIYCHKIFPRKQVGTSAENLFSEVRFYNQLGVHRFMMLDDIFNLDIKNSTRFFELIIKNGLDLHLIFSSGLRGDILTEDYIDLMVEAGTIDMAPALETASPRLQKLIEKNLNIEKLHHNINYICEKYPQVILELFIMHGFPTETHQEVRQTMDFFKSIKWIHFPYLNILKIFSNTKMEKFALENGISREAITRSETAAWHELPDTLPFPKQYTVKIQAELLNEYFLCKERLLHVLPQQMKVMTEDEIVQKYDSYLPVKIDSFSRLLGFIGISREELSPTRCLSEERVWVPDLSEKLREVTSIKAPEPDALRILLLDLDLYFSRETEMQVDLVNEPLGLIRLLTQLNLQFGSRINGRIAKSRIDFDNYHQLKALLEQFNPDVIGIRVLTFFREFFHKTVSLIRQWGINVPIIVGGPHVSTNYRTVLQDGNIDVAVLGEGEITLVELIGKIMENERELPRKEILEGIPGIAYIPREEKTSQGLAREIIMPDAAAERLSRLPGENPEPVNQPGDLAYIIYTSGSTGGPKGVMCRHNNLVNQVSALARDFRFDTSINDMLLTRFTFDVSAMHIFLVLTTGAKLFLVPGQTRLDPVQLWKYIHENQINVFDVVPSHLKLLLNYLPGKEPHLKYLFIGGEVFPGDLYRDIKGNISAEKIINIYGPTETTINAAWYDCTHRERRESIPIGKPLMNYRLYILDANHNVQPIGVAGELCISGGGLARGYLNNPELTAEKFCLRRPGGLFSRKPPPWTPRKSFLLSLPYLPYSPYSPIYKTGDLARWLSDGNIVFLGRIDNQVKLRGFRIELGEIENRLVSHKDIKEAQVLLMKDSRDSGEDRAYLCAYFVAKHQLSETQHQELLEYLTAALPAYMIPSYFIQLERIPLTPNGKIDREALKAHHEVLSPPGKSITTPTTEMERKIAETWKEVLRLDRVGIRENFFDLGGNSIDMVRVNDILNRKLGQEILMVKMFEFSTIETLAAYLEQGQGATITRDSPEELDECQERMKTTFGKLRK